MDSKLIFIYDGECPFCNYFAELLELKSNIPNLELKNGRETPRELPDWYDMDIKGAMLLKDNEILHGAKAINFICTQVNDPSDRLLEILRFVFASQHRTNSLFPFLLIARRISLLFKGVPRKIEL